MPIFVLLAALMMAAALAFVIVPLLRNSRKSGEARPDPRLRVLEQARETHLIDEAEYAAKRATLTNASPTAAPPHSSTRTGVVVLLIALLLPASALFLYRLVGAPQALDPAKLAAPPIAQGDHGPDMEKAIGLLVARLKDNPADVEGWALLGRAYQATNRSAESLDAFKRAHEAAPDNAAITVEYAQSLALSSPDHRIEGEPRALLEGVVASDPKNQRALWLLGIGDYQARRYDAAIARWNSLVELLEPGSQVQVSVKQQIAEAVALRDGKQPSSAVASNPTMANATSGEAAPASAERPSTDSANAPKLTIAVALDPKLQAQLDPEATLFVFARAASGPPMPLAIERLKASQLPLTVVLDESKGMLPNMKLSMFPQIVVGARISKSGNAMPQSGDLQVMSKPLDVHHAAPIELNIDQIVP